MSRDRILTVAARLFAAGGFEATSMRDIAGPSGLLAGSIYHHFHSKNDLVEAVYRAGVAEIGLNVEAAAQERATGRPVVPMLHACFSLGTVAGGVVGIAMTAANG